MINPDVVTTKLAETLSTLRKTLQAKTIVGCAQIERGEKNLLLPFMGGEILTGIVGQLCGAMIAASVYSCEIPAERRDAVMLMLFGELIKETMTTAAKLIAEKHEPAVVIDK